MRRGFRWYLVDAFQHQGGQADYWVAQATVTASGLDGDGARWARSKRYDVKETCGISSDSELLRLQDVSNTLKKLQVDDLYAFGSR